MTDPNLLAHARALAVISVVGGPDETRRALEGKQTLRGYATAIGTTPEQLVTDLLDWLAANPAVLDARMTYVEANAMIRLCTVLSIPVPEGLPHTRDEALIHLARATGVPDLQLRERLHHPARDRYIQMREEFLASIDGVTLEAVIKRVQNWQALWSDSSPTLTADS